MTARQPQIAEWVRNVQSEIDQLEKQLVMIQERLSPICRSAVPVPCGVDSKSPPEEMLVPVAENLREIHRRIQVSVGVLSDVATRLEV